MKRLILIIAGVAVAGSVAATPAIAGLAGNPSFSHEIPVPAPSAAKAPVFADDHSRDDGTVPASAAATAEHGDDLGTSAKAEPGDDCGGITPHAEPGDDRGGQVAHAEPGDDRGGITPHAEPGDDRGGATSAAEPSDDSGGHRGGRG